MRYFSEEDVVRLLPMRACIGRMREAFAALGEGTAQNQPRRRLILPSGAVLHQMAASWGGYFGTKIYSTHARHGAWFTVHLYDAETARPLAQFEANRLGQIRTGAASGLATELMAPPGARTVGLIGSGFQAWTQIEAVLCVRPVERVRVYSRTESAREEFAARAAAAFGVAVEAVGSAEEAVRGAAIVVTATAAKEPVLRLEWLEAGTHINAVGSNQAARRELPGEVVQAAELIGVDSLEQARMESGDLLLAGEWESLPLVELAELVRTPRASAGLTIFKSNGLAVEDVAAAALVYEAAIPEPPPDSQSRARR